MRTKEEQKEVERLIEKKSKYLSAHLIAQLKNPDLLEYELAVEVLHIMKGNSGKSDPESGQSQKEDFTTRTDADRQDASVSDDPQSESAVTQPPRLAAPVLSPTVTSGLNASPVTEINQSPVSKQSTKSEEKKDAHDISKNAPAIPILKNKTRATVRTYVGHSDYLNEQLIYLPSSPTTRMCFWSKPDRYPPVRICKSQIKALIPNLILTPTELDQCYPYYRFGAITYECFFWTKIEETEIIPAIRHIQAALVTHHIPFHEWTYSAELIIPRPLRRPLDRFQVYYTAPLAFATYCSFLLADIDVPKVLAQRKNNPPIGYIGTYAELVEFDRWAREQEALEKEANDTNRQN